MIMRRAIRMGIRVRPELHDAIVAEQRAAGGGIDATEALHRLALRNSDQPKYYLATEVSRRKEIELFAADLSRLLIALGKVSSRLAGPLREIPDDEARNANIAVWRRLSEELPPRLYAMVDVAAALCEAMCGVSLTELQHIDTAAKLIATWLPNRENQVKAAEEKGDEAAITEARKMRDGYKSFLLVVQRLLGRPY